MTSLNSLTKITDRSKKRMGRGLGSGKGKTGGRGQKGQKARGSVPAANVGAGLILYKKLPYRRGWSRTHGNPPRSPKPELITLSDLNKFKANSVVDLENLIKERIVLEKKAQKNGVKILNKGELNVKLEVKVPTSQKAKEQIEKMGGKVV